MTCGILQGALGSLYDADWIFQGFRNVEQIYDDRAEVTREKLQDFSVEISALELTNSGSYICEVKVGQEGAETPVRSQEIVLLVYREYTLSIIALGTAYTFPSSTFPLSFLTSSPLSYRSHIRGPQNRLSDQQSTPHHPTK